MIAMPDIEPYLSPAELGEVLGVNQTTVLRALVEIEEEGGMPSEPEEGKIYGHRVPIGRRDWIISLSELRRVLATSGNPPPMMARLEDVLVRLSQRKQRRSSRDREE